MPGVYRYTLSGSWNGYTGRMPGLPSSGGVFYVVPQALPAGAQGILLDNPSQDSFSATSTYTIKGHTSADKVYFALLMPGAVLDIGELPVASGTFTYIVDPAVISQKAPIYDTKYLPTGAAQLGRVLHFTLCAQEKAADGSLYWDMRRVIFRGTTVMSTR